MASTIATGARIGIADNYAASAAVAVAVGGPYYCVTQHATNNDLQMMKSADGATWTEVDSANAPACLANSPFDMAARIVGGLLAIEYVEPVESDPRVRRFDTSTDTWQTQDVGNADVENYGIVNNVSVAFRSNGNIISTVQAASNNDSSVRVWNGSSWSAATFPLSDSIICDTIMDSDDRAWFIYSDTAFNDFTYRSFSSANSYGTATDLDSGVHTTARIRRSLGVFFNDGALNKIGVLCRDGTGELDLWYGTTGGTTLGSATVVNAISTSTSVNVTSAFVIKVGSVLHVVWSEANTIMRDVSDDLATPAFGSDITVLSGETDTDPIPVPINDGTYWGIIFQRGGNVMVEWINAPPPSGGTFERVVPQDIGIQEVEVRTLAQDIGIADVEVRTLAQDIGVATVQARVVPQDIGIATVQQRTVGQDLGVQVVGQRAVPQTIGVLAAGARVVPQDIGVQQVHVRSVAQDIALATVQARTVPQTISLGLAFARVVPQDIGIQQTQARVVGQTIGLARTNARIVPQDVGVQQVNQRSLPQTIGTLVTQAARPTSDVTLGTWTDQAAGTTNIWQAIDEAIASDADYILNNNATNDSYEARVSTLTDPLASFGHTLKYRYSKSASGGNARNLQVFLYQGTTLIASGSLHSGITEVWTDGSYTLSGAEADAITDYSDLRLRFTASGATGGSGSAKRSVRVSYAVLEVPQPPAALMRSVPQTLGVASRVARPVPQDVGIQQANVRPIPQDVGVATVTARVLTQDIGVATQHVRTVPQSIGLLVTAVATRTVLQDIGIQQTNTRTVSHDIGVQQVGVRAVPQDVGIAATATRTVPQVIGVGITAVAFRTVPQDIGIRQTNVRVVTHDVGVQQRNTRIVGHDIGIQQVHARTLTQDIGVQQVHVRSVAQDIGIRTVGVRTVPEDVGVQQTHVRAVPQEVGLRRTNVRSVPHVLGVAVTNSLFRQVPQDIGVRRTNVRVVPQDLGVATVNLRVVTHDLGIQTVNARTVPQDIGLRATSTRSVPQEIGIRATATVVVPEEVGVATSNVRVLAQQIGVTIALVRVVPQQIGSEVRFARIVPQQIGILRTGAQGVLRTTVVVIEAMTAEPTFVAALDGRAHVEVLELVGAGVEIDDGS